MSKRQVDCECFRAEGGLAERREMEAKALGVSVMRAFEMLFENSDFCGKAAPYCAGAALVGVAYVAAQYMLGEELGPEGVDAEESTEVRRKVLVVRTSKLIDEIAAMAKQRMALLELADARVEGNA